MVNTREYTYTDHKKLAAGDYEDETPVVDKESEQQVTYGQWKKDMRKKFREEISPDKQYSSYEKQKMVSDFLRNTDQEWTKYVLYESIPFHKRNMKKSLLNCFRKSPITQERIKKKVLEDILSEDEGMRLCEDHVNAHPELYNIEGND